MNMNRTSAVRLSAALTLAIISLAAATEVRVIDATVPVRNRLRPPTSGRFGSIGFKLPLRIAVDVISWGAEGKSDGIVDLTLTNVGKKTLQLPTSLHPRDLEPQDPNRSYAVFN